MLSSLFLLASAGQVPQASLLEADEISLPGRELKLGDFFDISTGSPSTRSAMAAQVIASIPEGPDRISLSVTSLHRWARAFFPKLQLASTSPRQITVRFENLSQNKETDERLAITENPGCFRALTGVLEDEIITRANVRKAACHSDAGRGLVYFDRRDSVVRAARQLSAGDYLGRIRISENPILDRHTDLVFVTRSGPVQVTRNVHSLEAAKSGQRLFVATEDGQVFVTIFRSEVAP